MEKLNIVSFMLIRFDSFMLIDYIGVLRWVRLGSIACIKEEAASQELIRAE